jgi:hypothetical protein
VPQKVIEQSRQKSDLLQGFSDTILRAEHLEEQLKQSRELALRLRMRLDGNTAEYLNEIQWLTTEKDVLVAKNKTLHRENMLLQPLMCGI